ncbi:MAG: right-handed parallel beta-helix repeat-containing protein, partial [Nanoarchaeota archaeon]
PAGTHNYSWIANDTLGNVNTTPTFTFVVNKAAAMLNLSLNGTQANISFTEDGIINVTGNLTNGTGTIELFSAGTLINLGSTSVSNLTTFGTPGSFNITLRYNATQNFSTANVTYFVTVNSFATPVFLVKRYVWNLSACTTAACNVSGGELMGIFNDSQNITLVNDEPYRMTIGLLQIGDAKSWAIDPSVGSSTRESNLPDRLRVATDNNSIFDEVFAAEGTITDQNTADGGTKSGTLLQWNPTSAIAITGNDQAQWVNFSYTFNANGTTGNNTVTFRAELDVAGTDPTITNNLVWILGPDRVAPAITLNFPANNINATTTSYNFTWTTTDDRNTTLNCNLTINGVVNISGISTPNNTPTNRSVNGFSDGTHTWNVTCTDGTNANTSETRTFTVDTKGPAFDNRTEEPISGVAYTGGKTYNFTINATDATNAVNNVTLIFNNITRIATKDGLRYNVTITDLPAGTHNYSWIANDTISNTNTTPTFTFVVDRAAATVNLTLNGTQNNITIEVGSTINITANLTNGTGTLELLLNNQILTSGTSPLSNLTNFSNTGTFNVTARYNATQNFSSTNTTYTVTVQDTTPPTITLNFPVNAINTTTTSHNFTWTTTNSNASTACNLTINGVVNISGISTPNNTPTNRSVNGFSDGTHTWNVTCTDGTNTNTSETRTFTIDTRLPAITFISPTPANGTTINVSSAFINVSLNEPGSVALLDFNGTNSTMTALNSTIFFKNQTGLTNGTYVYRVYANDTFGNLNVSEVRTLIVAIVTVDTTPPTVNLSAPADNYYNDTLRPATVFFQCNATDDTALKNISLYITNATNSSFGLNQTTNVSGTSATASWNVSLGNGNYTWNCLAYDTAGNSAFAAVNRSLHVNASTTLLTNCTDITSPGRYLLGADIINSAIGKCINITSNDVSLDCQDHLVGGNGVAAYGIHINRATLQDTNINVTNCRLHNWNTAGLLVQNAKNNIFSNVASNRTPFASYGIHLNNAHNNSFTNISTHQNGYGWYIYNSNNNSFSVIASSSNAYYGIYAYSSSQNRFIDVNVTANRNGGLLGTYVQNSTFRNIIAVNDSYGLYLTNTYNNDVSNL